MLRPTITIILLSCLLATGCADLKGISTFSTSSAHTSVTINSLSYGYASYTADSCYINRENPKRFTDFLCDSTLGKKYDSSLAQEFTVLANYFAALAELSGSSEKINTGPIGSTIVAGTYGKLTITSTEAQIANALSTAVTDIVTLHFKSKRITELLQKHGKDVNDYITILALHLSNMEIKLKSLKDQLRSNANDMVNEARTDTARYILFSLYKEKSEMLDKVIAEYETKQQMVQKILEGHQQLVTQVDDLKSESLKKKLLTLASDLSYISNK